MLPKRVVLEQTVSVGDSETEGGPVTLPDLSGANSWINSAPLTPASLRGKVVLVDFWTYFFVIRLKGHHYSALRLRLSRTASAASDAVAAVTTVQFFLSGRNLGKQTFPQFIKSNAERRRLLSPLSNEVTVRPAPNTRTPEIAGNLQGAGPLRCVSCGAVLSSSVVCEVCVIGELTRTATVADNPRAVKTNQTAALGQMVRE
jgi:hypothetical protein